MRIKVTFLAGFAAGFLAGARAGRERYEQAVKLGKKAVEHPAVQQATKAAGAKATELSKVAGQKAAERMPKVAETAKTSATKVRGQLDKLPGLPGRSSAPENTATVNGDSAGLNGSGPVA
jgi:hypothetical protein